MYRKIYEITCNKWSKTIIAPHAVLAVGINNLYILKNLQYQYLLLIRVCPLSKTGVVPCLHSLYQAFYNSTAQIKPYAFPMLCNNYALQDMIFCEVKYTNLHPSNAPLTHCYLETHKRVIGKQCRPRSDAT